MGDEDQTFGRVCLELMQTIIAMIIRAFLSPESGEEVCRIIQRMGLRLRVTPYQSLITDQSQDMHPM